MSVQARARAQNMRVRWGGEGGVERMDERGGGEGRRAFLFKSEGVEGDVMVKVTRSLSKGVRQREDTAHTWKGWV